MIAAEVTWGGSESGNWNEGSYWSSGNVPTNGDTITFDSGSINKGGNYNIVVPENATLDFNGGTIYAVGNGSLLTVAPGATMNLKGGALTYQGFQIGSTGNTDIATVTISSGEVDIKGALTVGKGHYYDVGGFGTLTIDGSGATINTSTFTVVGQDDYSGNSASSQSPAKGTLKFTADGGGFSTINATSTATIKGDISVDMTNFLPESGVMYVTGSPTQTLISAETLDYSPLNATTTATDGWNLEQIGNDLVLTLDESQFAVSYADATSGMGYGLGNLGTEGWVTLNGSENQENASLSLVYDGDLGEGGMDGFLKYLAESLPEDSGITVTDNGPFITFANLDLDQYGKGSLYYDLEGFNTKYGASMSFIDASNHIPEPSTWTLLILGATALVFMRRKR